LKIKNRLKKHSLKFISILLSIFIWAYVLNSEKIKFEKTVMIDYQLPNDLLITNTPPQEVTFLIEGPRAFVKTVSQRDERFVVDLNRLGQKKQMHDNFEINPSQLNLPFGMKVEKFNPSKISINLEKKSSRIVPLKLMFKGQLSKNVSLTNTSLIPSEVEIFGPRHMISRLKEIPIKAIDLSQLVGSDQVLVDLDFPDKKITLNSGQEVRFHYQLKASEANLELNNIPIRFLSDKKKVTSITKYASLKLLIPEKIKSRSNVSSTVQVWAEIPSHERGEVEVPLKVILPPDVHLLELSPQSIIVNIE
jgi:YbbR domain-containing protein